jgi:imidazolonepropionase-like amidohydrolase
VLTEADSLATPTTTTVAAGGIGPRAGNVARGYDADLLVVEGRIENTFDALLHPQALLLRGTANQWRPGQPTLRADPDHS